MTQLYNTFTLFLSLLVEAMPFLLLGVLLSSSLILFLDESKFISKLPRNPLLGAIVGSFIGFFFPVCECGNIPVARRFFLEGLPNSVAIAFLLAAPTVNPVVIWSTYIAFRGQIEIVIFRVLFSLIIAITIACIFSWQKDARPLLKPILAKRLTSLMRENDLKKKNEDDLINNNYSLLKSGTFLLSESGKTLKMDNNLLKNKENNQQQKTGKEKFKLFFDNVIYEFRELGGVLIIGSAIAAIIQVFIPREIILNIGQDAITSIIAMMILAAVVSICSTVDSFFVLSFASSFTTSSLIAFLVFGPMIDIKGIGLMLSIFKPKTILYLFILAAQLTFIFSVSYGYFN